MLERSQFIKEVKELFPELTPHKVLYTGFAERTRLTDISIIEKDTKKYGIVTYIAPDQIEFQLP